MKVDLVSMSRDVVLRLQEKIAVGHHLAAGLPERVEFAAQALQVGQPGTGQVVEVEGDRGDALIVRGRLDGVDQIAYRGLGRRRRCEQLVNGLLERVARQLLDYLSAGRQDQRGAARHGRRAARQHRQQDEEKHQHEQQVHGPAEYVEATPHCTHHPDQEIRAPRRRGEDIGIHGFRSGQTSQSTPATGPANTR